MKRATWLIIFFFAAWMDPVLAFQEVLNTGDIPQVMERLFHFHIENKELTPTLIRRSLKLYIEQFDADKSYLLESEIEPYLAISAQRAEEICSRVQRKNYSDFIELNAILQKAILRARGLRRSIAEQLVAALREPAASSSALFSKYPKTEDEIAQRQMNRMIRFYLFHQTRTQIDSAARKKKVYTLFEKKINRTENGYLFLDGEGNRLSQEQIEHLFSLRILKSFAKSLDTHTAFFSPEEAYEMRLSLEKQFEGVGVVLSEGIDGVMIVNLIEGGPAELSGKIQINDQLVEIDGKMIAQTPFEEILDLLKKKDHSEIILGFKRLDPAFKKETFFRVSLTKQPIAMKETRIQTSYERVEDGIIGKIALHSFYESSDGISSEKDMKEAIRFFRQEGDLKGLILDLRENSGGFLGQAVRVAGLFVSNGVIVISKYGKGEVHYLRNIVGKNYFSGPLIVLTSKMSASASEIVAQALQDYGVALVVGDERTFGKGSIQYQTITDANADLFFKVTVGRYYTVSGRSTQIDGVLADIVVPTAYSPYKIGERYLEYPLPPDQVDSAYLDPLTDLDDKTRLLFQQRYLPSLQRVVPFWKKALPVLRQNSADRIAADSEFQMFLEKLETVRSRQTGTMVNAVDEPIDTRMDDLQMREAVHILKDMIHLGAEFFAAEAAASLPTGSD